jgi:aspartate racemase
MIIRGGCLCGGVRYEVRGAFLRAGHCHCSRCRRHSGAAVGTQGRVRREDFTLLSGAELVLLISEYRSHRTDDSYPPLLINSIDLTKMRRLVDAQALGALTDHLADAVLRLEKAGADFAVLAANTPHIVFDALRARTAQPMISIVEAACEEALALGLKRVGLLGTRFTMEGRFYPEVFWRRGIAVVTPEPEDQSFVHEKYLGELVRGVFLPETREGFLAVARSLRERKQADGIVLAGTELPLLLRDAPDQGIPFLDTTAIHVRRIVAEMLS